MKFCLQRASKAKRRSAMIGKLEVVSFIFVFTIAGYHTTLQYPYLPQIQAITLLAAYVLMVVLSFFQIILAGCLIFGVKTDNIRWVMLWMRLSIIHLFISILAMILITYIHSAADIMNPMIWVIVASTIALIFLKMRFLYVVQEYHHELLIAPKI